MSKHKNRAEFTTDIRPGAPAPSLSRMHGMPVGAQLEVDWHYRVFDMGTEDGQFALVDNPNAVGGPDETAAGIEWTQTRLTSSTMTRVETSTPAYIQIETAATTDQGQQMQNLGSSGARTLFDPFNSTNNTGVKEMYMEVICKFTDVADDDDTVEQMEFFMGFAPADTSINVGVDDFWGLYSADGSGNVSLVADDSTSSLQTATDSAVVVNLSNASGGGDNTNVADEWIRLAFRISDIDQVNNTALMNGYFDIAYKPRGAVENIETSRGVTLGVVNVPDAAGAPSIMFVAGENILKRLQIAKIIVACKYELGTAALV